MSKRVKKTDDELKDWFLSPISPEEYEKRVAQEEKMRESNRNYQKKKYEERKNEADKS